MLKELGTPLVLENLPDPHPGAGEAVVDIVAAPVLSYAAGVHSGARQYPMLLPLAVGPARGERSGRWGRMPPAWPPATNEAVAHAARMGGPFRCTVIQPAASGQ